MKRLLTFILALVALASLFVTTALAADGDPLDENGDTGGGNAGGDGGYTALWNTGNWSGMRITVIDVSDPARLIDGEQWGKVAAGTVSVDITGLTASDSFFTRTLAGDQSTPLTYGNKVTHFGKVSKMGYRDGAALASTTAAYDFYTVPGCPITMGGSQAPAQEIKDFINNEGMLTQIASWCGGGLTYETLTSGKYKLLVEPIMYVLIQSNKFAFTATEMAMYKPLGNTTYNFLNNTLGNAFYLEYDELGWDAWTGATNIKQPYDTIVDQLGMHIYSIAPDYVPPPPKSLRILKKSNTGGSLSGAQFTIVGEGRSETVTVSGTLTLDLADWDEGSYTATETVAPSGYELDATPQTFTISAESISPAELTFTNVKTPPPPPPPPSEVEFRKVEYGTEIGLGGAIFQLTQLSHWEKRLVDPDEDDTGEYYDDDNGDELNAGEPGYHHNVDDRADDVWEWIEIRQTEVVGTFLSEADGTIPIGALEAGSYAIEEIVPPAGYALQENIHERLQTFDVPREGGYEVKIVFANKPLPGLTILKVDEETGQPLAGAEFSIKHNGNIVYEGLTDANGTINLDGLPEGWYSATELAAPGGYLMRDETKNVFLAAGGSAQLKFDNRRKPTLEIVKLDAQNNQPLSGATFRVWETEGGTVGEFTTGADGKITISDLKDTIYTVLEISAPDGYLLNTQHKDILLEWGKVQALVFQNAKKPGLTVTKVDEATGAPLANAEFTVAHKGGAIVYEGKTDANGKIQLSNLDEGWYTVTETAAPYGYLAANSAKDVFLEGGSVVDIRFTNRRRPALEIIKLDAQTKQPLSGAKFRVWVSEGATIGEYVTDATGRVFIENLDELIYSVEEIEAPDGYILDAQHKDIRLEWGITKTLVYTDVKKPSLTLHKYDELTGEPLTGASFRLWLTDGATWSELKTTDANGTITWAGLEPGIYSVQEIDEPFGYFKDHERKEIALSGGDSKQLVMYNRPRPVLTILKRDLVTGEPLSGVKFKVERLEGETIGEFITDAKGMIELSPITGYLLTEQIYRVTEIAPPDGYLLSDENVRDVMLKWYEPTVVIFDNLKKPTLTVIKYDELTGKPLAGASFKLWRTEGETWSETQITGADGKITWTDLDAGIYSIHEIDAPYGYFKDTQRKEVLLEGGDNKELVFYNRPMPVLTILKRDLVTGEPLSGVKFKVQRIEGETVGEFITDAKGMIELSPRTGYLLGEQVYRITEVQPPEEYLLSESNVKNVLLKWYEPTEVIFDNLKKPTLIFIKTNGITGRGIDNATYKVEYEAPGGGIVSLGQYKTKCGLIVIPHVMPGWYVLTETSPAPGYSLPTDPVQRVHLSPGENSYTYTQTRVDLYVDIRTNANIGMLGKCGDWCGYLCSQLCGGSCGNAGGAFGGITITNGNGDPLGTLPTSPPSSETGTPSGTKPTLTAGTVTRVSNLTATVTFTSNTAGRYYYSAINAGAAEPIIATSTAGYACNAGSNTITVYLTAGAKDVYIKVKDADGNVSDALKISITAYAEPPASAPAAIPEESAIPEPIPDFSNMIITGGTVVYINPDFPEIKITFGNP